MSGLEVEKSLPCFLRMPAWSSTFSRPKPLPHLTVSSWAPSSTTTSLFSSLLLCLFTCSSRVRSTSASSLAPSWSAADFFSLFLDFFTSSWSA
jgi:hypothetical protein